MLISIDHLNDSASRFKSWEGINGRKETIPLEEEFLHTHMDSKFEPGIAKGNILGKDDNLVKRKEMISNFGKEPVEFAFERAVGNNDSVYSNFVELIAQAKQKVGRIVLRNGNENIGYATGFMVSEDLLLTNWHVFEDKESVAESEVQFFYELDTAGNPGKSLSFKLEIDTFFYTCKELDYCLVAVHKTDVTGSVNLASIGYIYLNPTLGKIGNEGEEKLNIIHHPNGDYKQLSIRENLFTKILPKSVWYESDTAPGSSGSPVFNDQWQVVALHHMGVADKNENGDYIDKDKKVIPLVGNKIDESKIHWIANEGIRTSVILNDIFSSFPSSPVINKLKIPPSSPYVPDIPKPPDVENHSQKNTPMETNNNNVNISFPASLLDPNGNVNININNKAAYPQMPAAPGSKFESCGKEEDFTEISKIDRENAMDYSDCKGYQSNFLNTLIPLPQPAASIQKFVAKLKNSDSIVLKYHHFSVIFHSVRMMPLISAINVEGDPAKRLDHTKRSGDVWLRDNRLDYDIQLNDKYYKHSGFDRGHMSRREDANWGLTAEDALRNANLTCIYTNACPQVNKLNQSQQNGLWGKLENLVLEHGAILQRGITSRISVFNGPIFNDTDSVFRGIQIPMEFFKIILWVNDANNLKATAFKLSQSDLVGDIDFEAIDIDQNIEFKTRQCSIRSLQDSTNIDFSGIINFDTYNQSNAEESMQVHSEQELKTLIENHKSSN